MKDLETLDEIQRRVLWLAASIVHHANRVRPNRSGVKVGGHQASSASMVSLMTALWLGVLEAPDRVSVKPHASPVLHALNYLLGRLDARYLTTLRQFGGLQSYPSRTKDPDPVDYSTGSVGLGATAPVWGAIAHRYVAGHFDVPVGGRQIALIGDAELDEGACWEAIADPMVSRLGEVMWVVDLNRQSLDRVVPDIAAGRLERMFEAAGWHSVMVKYGARLAQRPDMRERIDLMPNEEYQRLLRAGAPELRERLEVATDDLDDAALLATFRDLGGHDLAALLDGYAQADAVRDRPSVVFAYTIKGWSLPTEGHPANHSALLTEAQYAELAERLGADPGDPWARFPAGSAAAERVRGGGPPARARGAWRGRRRPAGRARVARPRAQRHRLHAAGLRPLLRRPGARGARGGRPRRQRLARRRHLDEPGRLDQQDGRLVDGRPDRLVRRRHGHARALAGVRPRPPHRARDRGDQPRRPARRARRDVVARGAAAAPGGHDLRPVPRARARALVVRDLRGRPVDPRGHAERRHARPGGRRPPVGRHAVDRDRAARLRGLRAGVRAGPRVVPAPRALAAGPAGRDVGVLPALDAADRPGAAHGHARGGDRGRLRAAARGDVAEGERDEERLAWQAKPQIVIAVMGALVPEAMAAADMLAEEAGVAAEVVCVTSADLLFRSFQARAGLGDGDPATLERLFPHDAPIVALLDGHPHTLAFLGPRIACLGVHRFGQSGDIAELYEHHEIDAESVVGAALDLLG